MAACTSSSTGIVEVEVIQPASTPTLSPLATVALTPTPVVNPTATPFPTVEPLELTPPSNDLVEKNSAGDVLKEALARTGAMGSYHYEMEMTLTPRSSGLTLEVDLLVEGDFQQPGNFSSIINLTVRNLAVTSREIKFDGVKFGTDPMTRLWRPEVGIATPAGEVVDFLSIDPDDLRDIEVLGSGDLNGVDVYRIRATAPAGLIGSSPSPVELNYWLGVGDLVVRQVLADGVIAWPEANLLLDPGAGGVSAISMTLKLSGFGRPVDIQAPDPSMMAVDLTDIDVITAAGYPLANARGSHTANLLATGEVIVTGGTANATPLASTEIYDPATGRWSDADDLAEARSSHTATTLLDGRVLVVGGINQTVPVGGTEIFDPATREWSSAGALRVPRASHTATLLRDGRVLIVGGDDVQFVFGTVDIYDPESGDWSAGARLSVPRAIHSATLLADGRVLVSGGIDAQGNTFTDAEIYDPASDSWTAVAPKNVPVAFHGSVLLQDGRVLTAGGVSAEAVPVRTAEIYDLATDEWTLISSSNDNHIAADPVRLDDGKVVFVAGGNRTGSWAIVEVYDPVADEWTVAGKVNAPRGLHTSVLLDNGLVFIAGGGDNFGPTKSVELFDPVAHSTVPGNLRIDLNREYEARFTLPIGEFTVQLFPQDAPITVDNFVGLARDGFYDGLTFHRVFSDSFAHGGDPLGTGRGRPGYAIPDEISDRRHDGPGVLSMVTTGPNTGGTQFLITYAALPSLDGIRTVFGQVIEGMDVVRQIPERNPDTATVLGMTITSIEIIEK
ncbi:MAG: peptidylprolyl isomerase [Chloroflexi bacterium]|nr:peptidylprolyl isomerase [Chloroflexota bacterium]